MKEFNAPRIASTLLCAFLTLGSLACARKPATLEQVEAKVQHSEAARSLLTREGQSLSHATQAVTPNFRTEKYKHFIHGIEVIGSGVSYQENPKGERILDQLARFDISTIPALSEKEALALATKFGSENPVESRPALKILPPRGEQSARLAYIVELASGKEVWIEANTGSHIATVSGESDLVFSARNQGLRFGRNLEERESESCWLQSLASRQQTSADRDTCRQEMERACQVLDMQDSLLAVHPEKCVPGDDAAAERARANAELFLAYFEKIHGRRSYDNQGAAITSVIHVGQLMDNAYWSRRQHFIGYGDGDGTTTRDYTYGVDIAAHELTHALVEHTAKLLPFGESGALNESLADYFGKVIEGGQDWVLGKSILLDPSADGARNLANPNLITGIYFNSEGRMRERQMPGSRAEGAPIVEPCSAHNDSCSIHFNATIPGHAWYLIDRSLGRQKAERLIYTTLTHSLLETADFEKAAQGALEVCGTLFDSTDCTRVKAAFLDTGMLSER